MRIFSPVILPIMLSVYFTHNSAYAEQEGSDFIEKVRKEFRNYAVGQCNNNLVKHATFEMDRIEKEKDITFTEKERGAVLFFQLVTYHGEVEDYMVSDAAKYSDFGVRSYIYNDFAEHCFNARRNKQNLEFTLRRLVKHKLDTRLTTKEGLQ